MKVGILCFINAEIEPYKANLTEEQEIAGLKFCNGKLGGTGIIVVKSGIGKVNAALATQILIQQFNVDCIIISGTAGSMAAHLNILDTVICTKAVYHDTDLEILTSEYPFVASGFFNADGKLIEIAMQASAKAKNKIHSGLTVSGDRFINIEGRGDINTNFAPLCVDMESAAVAHICYIYKTPFLAIRSITDTESEHGIEVFNKYKFEASVNSYKMVTEILKGISKQ